MTSNQRKNFQSNNEANNSTVSKTLKISGFNTERTRDFQLINLINSKRICNIVQYNFDSKRKNFFVTLQTVEQAKNVYNLLNRFQFFNTPLHVEYVQTRPMFNNNNDNKTNNEENHATLNDTKFQEFLQTLIDSHYNAQEKSLNLSKISGTHNGYSLDFSKNEFINTLLSTISSKYPQLQTLFLNGNQISSLNSFQKLGELLPSLINLSLQDNLISDIEELNNLQSSKLKGLILINNSIQMKSSPTIYINQVFNKIPTLETLDGQRKVIQQPSQQMAIQIPNLSIQNNVVTSQNQIVCFLYQYFDLFDSNRNGLSLLYAEHASFSLSSVDNTENPMYATNGNGSSYNKYNTLQFGSSSIVKFLSTLPKTQHHAPEIFIHSIYESIPNSPLYSVNISGFSLEIETNIKKFFNRTFLLISTKNSILILTDQLHILPYSY